MKKKPGHQKAKPIEAARIDQFLADHFGAGPGRKIGDREEGIIARITRYVEGHFIGRRKYALGFL